VASNAINASIPVSYTSERRIPNNAVERRYRNELAFFGKMLHKRHYVSGCDGNLSVRLDEGRILTTPTGMSKGMLKPDNMVIIDIQGSKLAGALQPSSEIGMHLTIYQTRPDVGAIVHAHPSVATGFACAGMDLTEPICSELVLTLGRIPLAPYASPGSPELSDCLRPFVPEHDAILMQNHGVVAYGETLSQAYLNMETVEHSAVIMLVTRLLGMKATLNPAQVIDLLEKRSAGKGGNRNRSLRVAEKLARLTQNPQTKPMGS
jgi:L-fuculose-phosphate aldolase